MQSDDVDFDLAPQVEDLEMSDPADVQEMIDNGEIGLPSEYDYDDPENFVVDVLAKIAAPDVYEALQEQREKKWKRFLTTYDESGGVIYNPETSDEYYTDDDDYV